MQRADVGSRPEYGVFQRIHTQDCVLQSADTYVVSCARVTCHSRVAGRARPATMPTVLYIPNKVGISLLVKMPDDEIVYEIEEQ